MQQLPNNDEANRAIEFISRLTHTGDFLGEPFDLRPWQESIIRQLFGTLRPDARRQYTRMLLTIGRKNGKSELIAALALYALCALPGNGKQIYSCASTIDQAGIIYEAAEAMIRNDPTLQDAFGLEYIPSRKRIVCHTTFSYFRSLSGQHKGKLGGNPSVVLFDELQEQTNRGLWDALTTGQGARKEPLTISIMTGGTNKQSIGYEQYQYAKKVQSGQVKDPQFLPILYTCDDEDDWTDPDTWRKCSPALGDWISLEWMAEECRQAQEIPAKELSFRRLYLNQWVEDSHLTWIPDDAWQKCATPVDPESWKDRDIYAACDLASVADTNALVLVSKNDEGLVEVLPYFWVPENVARHNRREKTNAELYLAWEKEGYITRLPGETITPETMQNELLKTLSKFPIRHVTIDKFNAYGVADTLENNNYSVNFFPPYFSTMNTPCKELERLVLSQKLAHSGHPVLRWQMQNTVIETDASNNYRVSRKKSTEKIDGIWCLVAALAIMIDQEGEQEIDPSNYEMLII